MSASSSESIPATRSGTFGALANTNFRKFLVGQGISLTGTWMQAAVVGWVVYDKSKSEWMSGLVEAAGTVPGLLVGVLAGALADRVVPRTMIMLSQLAQMLLTLLLATLALSGSERIWHLALIVALTRVFVTFEMPARQVFLYQVVGREMMVNAIALNSGLFNAARVLGPALGGFLFDRFGAGTCFGLNGFSYLAAITSLLLIRLQPRVRESSVPKKDLWGGFAYLMHDHRVRTLFLLMTGFGLCGGGFAALGPAYAQRLIGTGPGGYSLLLAMAGLGATFGALAVASLGWVERRERIVLGGIAAFCVAVSTSVMLPPLFGPFGGTARLIVGAICLFGTGVGVIIFYAATQTMIQAAVPEALRGRIMGIWMIVYSGSVPLGCLWSGKLAQWIGVVPVMNLAACLCGTLALVAGLSGGLRETKLTWPIPTP